jgi:hypothetical protein
MSAAQRIARADDVEVALRLAVAHGKIRFNLERAAVQVVSCDGATIAHLPLRAAALKGLRKLETFAGS